MKQFFGVHVNTTLQRHNTENSKQILTERDVRPQSQFLYSCVYERFMYSHDWSAYFAAGKYVGLSWEYINRSDRQRNVEIGTEAVQFLF
jgi:hypothetical protein